MALVARRLRRASARIHVPRYALDAGYTRLTLDLDFSQWHTYAALWQPGKVTWLLDGEPLYSQRYGAESVPAPNTPGNPAGTFAVLDQESPGETLILGCGKNWPIEIDWVHVWQ